ncbi:MAG: mandelate racemase/muconate lactonizing enzyme family protein [Phycisphaerae bacterium]
MKVRQLETYTRGHLSFVIVRADDAAEGVGQISTYNADISATVFHRQVAPHAIGAEVAAVADVEALLARILEAEYKFPGSYVRRALGGLETALLDLLAKAAGKSVCKLLGGERKPIVAYGSSMRRDITPADEAARLVRLRDEKGFGAFKIRIGKVNGHDGDAWPGRTEELVPTVRKAVGDDVKLLVDGNSCYTPAGAVKVGRMLEDNGVCHFEEPCPYWQYEWTAEVAAALDVPVAGGEQDCFLPCWRRMIAMRAVDIVQPDILYIGGITRAAAVAAMAAEANMPCVPHSANLSLVTLFTLHLLAAIPNAGQYVEFSIEPNDWSQAAYRPGLEVRDGLVEMPPGPGWGVELNADWLAASNRQVSP